MLLAIKYAGWKTKVAYFNPYDNLIKIEKMWQPSNNYSKRAFFILKGSKNWITSKKWTGFDWIIEELNHLSIFNKNIFSKKSISKAKKEYDKLIVNEWNEIKTLEDIEDLKNLALDFHDAYISNIEEDKNCKTIDFDTTWGCHILLRVCDIQEMELNYKLSNNYNVILDDSNIKIINNNLSFEFYAMFYDESNNEIINRIICKTAFWKLVVLKHKN